MWINRAPALAREPDATPAASRLFRGFAAGALLVSAVACGPAQPAAPSAPATATPAAEEALPVDAAGVRLKAIERVAYGPWWGSGCPEHGACGCGSSRTLAEELNCQLDRLRQHDIPVSVYLFDGSAWSLRNSADTNTCSGADCCSWKLGDDAVLRLGRERVRALLHFWGGCHDQEQYQRAYGRLGRSLLGFYLDDGTSDADVQEVDDFLESVEPGNWEAVAKAYQGRQPSTTNRGLSEWANVAYVGDLPYDFAGLQDGINRVLSKARYLPAPYNELTGYAFGDEGLPDEEVYYRRLHFGCFQPVMAHTPYANADPWRPEYGPDLVPTYRYYAWLHKELIPYFHSYAIRMHEDPSKAVLRRGPNTYSFRVGNEIYAPFVTEATRSMTIELPPGQWIDYWDESRVVSGTLDDEPVPLGGEPIFLRQGAIIPMEVERPHTGHGTAESAGSLTLLVYPSGTSSFRYYDETAASWVTFTSSLSGGQLTLTADPDLPSRPVLYRIGRWNAAPASVAIDGATVTINQGGSVPAAREEAVANGASGGAWFYDAEARRLIVKTNGR